MQIAHGSPPRHVEECLRRRDLLRQATSPGVFANGSGPAAREETNEVGRSWTGSLWSRTRRATGPSKPESALQSRSLLVVRGITIRAEATLWIIALLVMWSSWSLFTTTNSGSPWSPRRSRRPRSSLGQWSPTRSHELEAKRHGLSVQDVMLYVSGGATASLLISSAPATSSRSPLWGLGQASSSVSASALARLGRHW